MIRLAAQAATNAQVRLRGTPRIPSNQPRPSLNAINAEIFQTEPCLSNCKPASTEINKREEACYLPREIRRFGKKSLK